VSRFWKRRRVPFGIGTERPAYQPRARPDFTRALGEQVRESRRAKRPAVRVAFAAGLSVFMLVALAAFGGLGYAADGGRNAVHSVHGLYKAKKGKARSGRARSAVSETPAENQYRGMRCTIMHRTGNGGFVIIEVAGEAVPAHMRHGDPPPLNCEPRH
jgi:hypothetical protein